MVLISFGSYQLKFPVTAVLFKKKVGNIKPLNAGCSSTNDKGCKQVNKFMHLAAKERETNGDEQEN